jgi:hypothetical protein
MDLLSGGGDHDGVQRRFGSRDLYPDGFRFLAPEREGRIPDADHERVPPRPGLSEDLELLAAEEAQLEQPTLQGAHRSAGEAYSHNQAGAAGRQGAQAHVTRVEGDTRSDDSYIHAASMDENGSYLQRSCNRAGWGSSVIISRVGAIMVDSWSRCG